MLLCLSSAGSTAALAAQSDWQALATGALQAALTARHPDVTRWQITALVGERLQQRLAERTVMRVEVGHTGKRSAVHIWCDPAAMRPCATVWFAVSAMQPVLSSQRELAQGSGVVAADFVMQEHDVMNLRCVPLLSPDGLQGMRTTQHIAAGSAVCREHFEARPAVSRGDVVAVRVVAGAIAITARAIAQQDGVPGQRVAIKLAEQAAPIRATVTAAGRVSVGESHE